MNVADWLRNLGLSQYESAFIENAIDIDVLPELSEHDLEKLGIPLGHRKRLVRAIKEMAPGGVINAGASAELVRGSEYPPGSYRTDRKKGAPLPGFTYAVSGDRCLEPARIGGAWELRSYDQEAASSGVFGFLFAAFVV